MEVPLALQLLEMNALLRFGAFAYVPAGDVIIFSHTLLGGATLDAEELNTTIRDVAIIADEYDDRIAARYGGQTMQELLEESVIDHFRTAHGRGPLQVLSSERPRCSKLGRRDRHDGREEATSSRRSAGTPIVKLQKVARHVAADIYVKCEYLNPGGSMKDRVALQHHRRRRAARPAQAGRHHRRGDQRQHRRGAGAGRGHPRLQVRLRHARQDVAGEDRDAARVRRARSSSARPPSSPTIRAATTRSRKRIADETPNCVLREPVPQPGQPRGALPVDRRPRSGSRPSGEIDVFVAGMGTGGTI